MSNTETQVGSKKTFFEQLSLGNLQLIKGTFTPPEAKEVLMNLISSKISFHNKKNLRSYENHGREDQNSKQRIEELEKVRKQLLMMLAHADENDRFIRLESQISIEILDGPE